MVCIVHISNNNCGLSISFLNQPICILCIAACTPESDIVILLDASSSMGETEWFRIQEYTKFLISHFNINSNQMRVGVLTYANQVDVSVKI